MEKSVQITLIIVVGIIVIASIGYTAFSSIMPSTNTVTGNGQATIEVLPDLVKVYFNVQTKADTSEEAKNQNAEIIDDLTIELIKKGFERKEIQTQNFNIYPEYSWEKSTREIIGYQASHTIIVEMSTEDSDKIGDVIDAGVDAGAGISYINFELSQEKENQYKSEALKLAAEDAKIKADSIAQGLGKDLGKLVSVSDENFYYSPWRAYGAVEFEDAAVAKAQATNIQPSEQQISAQVTAMFKLK